MMGSQGKMTEQQRKAEKRAAALRENLRRRKEAGTGKPAPVHNDLRSDEEGSDENE